MFVGIDKLDEKIKSRVNEIADFVISRHAIEEDGFISMMALAILGENATEKLEEVNKIATAIHELSCSCDKQKH